MMYPYMELPDGTEIVHSHILDKGDGPCVEVHFERPKDGGFDSARAEIPSYKWIIRDGYSDEEISEFEVFLRNNAHLFFKFAKRGGICA